MECYFIGEVEEEDELLEEAVWVWAETVGPLLRNDPSLFSLFLLLGMIRIAHGEERSQLLVCGALW